jgi:hypothetical protein
MKTVYSLITDSIEDYNKSYKGVYNLYLKVPVMELDFVNASVSQGKVNWEKTLIDTISDESITYLRGLEKVNLNLMVIRYLKRRSVAGLAGSVEASASSRKMILSSIRKTNIEDEKFDTWFRNNSPMGMLGRMMKTVTRDNDRKTPINVNSRYYMQMVGRMIYKEQSMDMVSMMSMELLTGRRIAECNIKNFKRMDVSNVDDRNLIIDYYSIVDESVIDKLDWYWFTGQLKAHRDVGGYPIPTLMQISAPKFKEIGDRVNSVVTGYNINKGLNPDLWVSDVGGVRSCRGKTLLLQKKLLPQLDKAHNIRAIYASIMASCLLDYCNVADTVNLMGRLMGHIDKGSTNKYRIVKVTNKELTPDESSILDQYIELVKDVEGIDKICETRGRKPGTNFTGWTSTHVIHYRKHYSNEDSFDDIKAIAPHDVDLNGFPDKTGEEYIAFYKSIEKIVLDKTGVTYKYLKKRYSDIPFRMMYVVAQDLRNALIDPSVYSLKKELDSRYSDLSVQLQERAEKEKV